MYYDDTNEVGELYLFSLIDFSRNYNVYSTLEKKWFEGRAEAI